MGIQIGISNLIGKSNGKQVELEGGISKEELIEKVTNYSENREYRKYVKEHDKA